MIYLTKENFQEIIGHCQKEYPKEACGILAGSRGWSRGWSRGFSPVGNRTSPPIKDNDPKGSTPGVGASAPLIISKVYKMVNISDSPETCYFMKPEEQLKVFKEMRNLDIEMLGIYHSHSKSLAYPSQRDCEMAFYPEVSYVIISLRNFNNPDIRAFKIIEGKIEEEKIVIEKGSEK